MTIITVKEAAKMLNLHTVTIYRLLAKGDLPGAKIGGQWRFPKEKLEQWLVDRIGV